MRRHVRHMLCLLVLLSLALPFSTQAQQPTPQAGQAQQRLDRTQLQRPEINLSAEQRQAIVQTAKTMREARASGETSISVMIELQGEAVIPMLQRTMGSGSIQSADAVTAARTQGASIQQSQDQLVQQLKAQGGVVLYRAQRTYNGIAARVPVDKLLALQALPGVKAIHRLTPKRLENISGAKTIGSSVLWEQYQLTGKGVTIGIIDTGVDYTHTNFGGDGKAAFNANDTETVGDLTAFPASNFPTAKVVGGWDFAGDDYDADSSDPAIYTPQPDPDPIDCNGHGSHVAGSAAGYGVNIDGSTYTGAYTETVGTTATMRIGPGSAPEAELYALRVFGCDGTTLVDGAAVEWATDPNGDYDFSDHLDVINLSLGADYSSADAASNPDITLYNNAIAAGVILVGSAGNAGDSFYINGGPGIVDRGISVAASVDELNASDGFLINAPAAIAGLYPAGLGALYNWEQGGVTDDVVYPPTQRNGCAAFDAANAALISGKIALLDWDDNCGSVTRGANAAAAGATGMLLVYDDTVIGIAINGSPTIPSMVTNKTAGDLIKDALANSQTVNVTLSADYQASYYNLVPELEDTIATFSSRGVRRLDSVLKPDISAPGVSIVSTAVGSGNKGTVFEGTSMAAPHISGVMAQLRQKYPTWSVEQLKARLMNTAVTMHDVDGDAYSPSRQGAGRASVGGAVDMPILAYNADGSGRVSLSFGAPEVQDEMTYAQNVRIANMTSQAATYDLSATEVVTSSGVYVDLPTTSVTLAPYSSRTVPVLITVRADEIDWSMDDTTSPTQSLGFERPFLNEHAGYIMITQNGGSGAQARVPFHIAPRPATDMRLSSVAYQNAEHTQAMGTLSGSEVDTADWVGLAWALELQDVNVDDPFTTGAEQAADIQYVGVGSDVAATGVLTDDTMIYFGISTYAPHTTPQGGPGYDTTFNIFVDTDGDGIEDYWVFNYNVNQFILGNADPDEAMLVFTYDLVADDLTDAQYINALPYDLLDTGIYNTSMIVLPVTAEGLGLTAGDSRFSYYVETWNRESLESWSDISYPHWFDPAAPAIDTAPYSILDMPLYFDLAGTPIGANINAESAFWDQPKGLLVLHSLNAEPNKAEWIKLTDLPQPELFRTYVPDVAR